jgi:hypothetical protein
MEVMVSNLSKKKTEREKAREQLAEQVAALSQEVQQRKQSKGFICNREALTDLSYKDLYRIIREREAEVAKNVPEMLCYEEQLALKIIGVKGIVGHNVTSFNFNVGNTFLHSWIY